MGRPEREWFVISALMLCNCGGDAARPVGTSSAVVPVRMVAVAGTGVDIKIVNGDLDKPYIVDAMGTGVCLIDFDRDGLLDLYVVNGSTVADYRLGRNAPSALYRNQGDFTFVDVADASGVAGSGWSQGCAVGDVDRDGWSDLYVTAIGPNRLYRNRGDGSFEERGVAAGVADPRWSTSAAFTDYDSDGNLDLYVANYVRIDFDHLPSAHAGSRFYQKRVSVFAGPQGLEPAADALFRGRGDGTFEDVTVAASVLTESAAFGLGVAAVDLDGDADVDIYVANDSQPNFLFENLGDGSFREIGLRAGAALSADGRAQAGMGIASGDIDDDGRIELFVTNFADDYNTLYQNLGGMQFSDASENYGLSAGSFRQLGWGTHFFDVEHDGDLDLFVANGHVYPQIDEVTQATAYRQANQLWIRDGRGFSVSANAGSGLQPLASSRGSAVGDLDGDGRVDLVIVNIDGGVDVVRNESPQVNHWIGFQIEGRVANRDGLGVRVELGVGGRTRVASVGANDSYLSSSDRRLVFGLGGESAIASVAVHWPGGSVDRYGPLTIDRYHRLTEGDVPLAVPVRIALGPVPEREIEADTVRAGPAAPAAITLKEEKLSDTRASAERLLHAGRSDEALALYEALVAHAPDHAESHLGLGTAAFRAGRIELAAQHLERAVELAPGSFPAQLQLAEFAINLQRLDQGERAARAALSIRPADASAAYLLGVCLAALNQHDQAVKAFDVALANADRQASIRHKRGLSLLKLGRDGAALSDFELALGEEPGHVGARYGAYLIRSRRGDQNPAMERSVVVGSEVAGSVSHVESRVRSTPDALPERMQLARLYEEMGRDGDALAQLKEVLRRVPTDLHALTSYARIAARGGREVDALKLLAVASANHPSRAEIPLERARIAARAARDEEAVVELRAALNLDPACRECATLLARVLVGNSRFPAVLGVAAARRSRELGERDPVTLARSLMRAGEMGELEALLAVELPLASGAERRKLAAIAGESRAQGLE